MAMNGKPDDPLQAIKIASGAQLPERKESKTRENGKQKAIITWHAPEVRRQLAMIAAEYGTTNQKLVAEALNWLFVKYQKEPIA